jgi:hypothetical protein
MESLILAPSNSEMREPQQLANKAGFFCATATGISFLYKPAACLYRTLRRGNKLAQVNCLTAVLGGPLLLFPPFSNVKQFHHVHPTTTQPAPAGHYRATSALSCQMAPGARTPGHACAQARSAVNPSYATRTETVARYLPPFLFIANPATRRG